ncbi:dynein regulatory complex subunit 4 [Aethina tumida]|uniref:dynein regulatory complex subunit 4 n=1 Tax=Aethina tumida TaxID=116153 RepID=UPI0021492B8E|nr:dynein regulatory complex subunit 4 [Aethina tumida]
MPPKAKKGGGMVIDGVDTAAMTREQLEVFCLRIKEENDREREERNFFQMERDKIRTFWEITKNELEEARCKLRNKDRQIEEAAEKNEGELKFYRQKIKHLQFEHQNDLTEAKAEALVSLKMAEDSHNEQERQLLRDKKNLKRAVHETEFSHQEQLRGIKLDFSENISNVRTDFENKARVLEIKYEKKFQDLKTELNTKHTMEIAEIEERKNTQITELTKHHDRVFNEMRNYYNDITLNNLALISSLKDQMDVLRNQNQRMSKQVSDLQAQNKALVEPLAQAQRDADEYKRQLVNYEKDKLSLANTKAKLEQTKSEFEDLRWANDALELRFGKLQAEKEELHNRFVTAILEVQQKTGMKNVLLQKRVNTLANLCEQREVVIGDLAVATKQQPTNKKLEKLLASKNATISDLEYELARMCKAHDDLISSYEEKLLAYGIPVEELGFVPLRFKPKGQGGLSKGPAGLVTQNK